MTIQLTGVNRSGSPLLSLSQGTAQDFTWSPYGNCPARAGQAALLPGFNGERADPLSGVTHLGNGYRAYNPTLMRFTCPDSHSPFGNGGVNPYAYCSGDPINQTDPSGHGPALWTVLAGILAGEISAADAATYALVTAAIVAQRNARKIAIGAGIASLAVSLQVASNKTQESNPQASRNLQWAALGLGVAASAYLIGKDTCKAVRKIMQMVSQPARLVALGGGDGATAATGQPVRGRLGGGLVFSNEIDKVSGNRFKCFYQPGCIGDGEDVILTHGSEDGRSIIIAGEKMSAYRVINFFEDMNIDLSANKKPLHLICCHLGGAIDDPEGFANALADLLDRDVITYDTGGEVFTAPDAYNRFLHGRTVKIRTEFGPQNEIEIRKATPNIHTPSHRDELVACQSRALYGSKLFTL
jgi:RHS repeat-associated protein